jgi:hypothetical protein
MLLDPAVSIADVPGYIRFLIQLAGASAWEERERDFSQQIRENPPFENYVNERFAIERAMATVLRYRRNTRRYPAASADIGRLYALAAMVARVYPRLSAAAQKTLAGRIAGGLNDDVGLASVAFEMKTACHFMSHGFDVEFHDLEQGGGYDFLARRDTTEVGIECKTVSGDLGRKIHLRRQYQLSQKLYPVMGATSSQGVGRLVIATFPDRLGGDHDMMNSIATQISAALSGTAAGQDDSLCSIDSHSFEIANSPFSVGDPHQLTEDNVIEFFRREFAREVRQTVVLFRPGESATIVALQSAKPDKFLEGVYRQLKEGTRQLSDTRAGVLCVQFLALTGAQLRDVADYPAQTGQPSALQAMTAKFFDSPNRNQVHTVAYTAPGTFDRHTYRTVDRVIRDIAEDAPSYCFTNKNHPNVDDSNYRFFSKTRPTLA